MEEQDDLRQFRSPLQYRDPRQDRKPLSVRCILLTVFGGLAVGVVVGYFASVFLGLYLWPDSNVAPLPFLFTLCPAITIATPLIWLWLIARGRR
jgi:hypothetical protein